MQSCTSLMEAAIDVLQGQAKENDVKNEAEVTGTSEISKEAKSLGKAYIDCSSKILSHARNIQAKVQKALSAGTTMDFQTPTFGLNRSGKPMLKVEFRIICSKSFETREEFFEPLKKAGIDFYFANPKVPGGSVVMFSYDADLV